MKKILIPVMFLAITLVGCSNKTEVEKFQEKNLTEQLRTIKNNDIRIKNTPKETFEKSITDKLAKKTYYDVVMKQLEFGVKAKESDNFYTLYFRPAGIRYNQLTKEPVELKNFMVVTIRDKDGEAVGIFATDTKTSYLYKNDDLNYPMNSLDLANVKAALEEVSDKTIEREMSKQLEEIVRQQEKILNN